jgi:phosphocarrier protein HPr
MQQIELTIQNQAGLHARPASDFVQLANQFQSNISVSYRGKAVNAKSILGVLTLGAAKGAIIQVSAEGADAQQALSSLQVLIESSIGQEGK